MNIVKIIGSNTFRARVEINEKFIHDRLSMTDKELQEFRMLVGKAAKSNDNRKISLFYGCFFDKDSKGIEYSNYLCGLLSDKLGVRSELSKVIYKVSRLGHDWDSVKDENAFSKAILEPLRNLYNCNK